MWFVDEALCSALSQAFSFVRLCVHPRTAHAVPELRPIGCYVNMVTVAWAGRMLLLPVDGGVEPRRQDRFSHSYVESGTVFICIGVAQPNPRTIHASRTHVGEPFTNALSDATSTGTPDVSHTQL